MIRTTTELRAWLDEQDQRHQKISDTSCSCGLDWSGYAPNVRRSWEQHAAELPITDLGDVLPSDTVSGGSAFSWRENARWLYDTLDACQETEDKLLDTLTRIAINDLPPGATASECATAAVQELSTGTIWAAAVTETDGTVIADLWAPGQFRSSSGE